MADGDDARDESGVLDVPVILGAGPVGRAIAAALLTRGARPRLVTRSGTAPAGTLAVRADLSDPVAARGALRGATMVFQCTQPPYHRWPQEFPALQHAVVRACEAVGAPLVAIDNLYSYGPVRGVMTEDLPARPTTRKGRVRAAMWAELISAHEAGRLRAAAVRAADLVGPGVRASAYGERFFAPLVRGGKAQLLGSPDTRHSVTRVADLAEAAVRLAVTGDPAAWGRSWHAPTAPARTQRELVQAAAEAAGQTAAFTVVRPWQLRLAGVFQPAARELIELSYEFTDDFFLDSSAFQDRFRLTPTPLSESLAETVAWYGRQDR